MTQAHMFIRSNLLKKKKKTLLEVIMTGEQMKRTVTLRKHMDFSGFNTVGNSWNDLRTQLNNM